MSISVPRQKQQESDVPVVLEVSILVMGWKVTLLKSGAVQYLFGVSMKFCWDSVCVSGDHKERVQK